MYLGIVEKILKIIDEDKNKPCHLLKYDLNRLLEKEIDEIKENSYECGFQDGKSSLED